SQQLGNQLFFFHGSFFILFWKILNGQIKLNNITKTYDFFLLPHFSTIAFFTYLPYILYLTILHLKISIYI
ncbi:hypothetical protein GLOIN_2v1603333, partial [Rhizophagus irregularis DAOM 181602=DAOM 197198]